MIKKRKQNEDRKTKEKSKAQKAPNPPKAKPDDPGTIVYDLSRFKKKTFSVSLYPEEYDSLMDTIALLIGIALDKGQIRSIDDKVLDYFPDHKVKRGEKTIYDVTIRHLLTLRAPYKRNSN